MKTEKKTRRKRVIDKESLKKILYSGMEYFVLGSLISADTCVDEESCQDSIDALLDIRKTLKEMTDEEISTEKRNEICSFVKRGLRICRRDLKEYKEKSSLKN